MPDFRSVTNQDLFHIIFEDDGQVKACGRDACIELIERLRKTTGRHYGDIHTGRLKLPDAYNVAKQVYL